MFVARVVTYRLSGSKSSSDRFDYRAKTADQVDSLLKIIADGKSAGTPSTTVMAQLVTIRDEWKSANQDAAADVVDPMKIAKHIQAVQSERLVAAPYVAPIPASVLGESAAEAADRAAFLGLAKACYVHNLLDKGCVGTSTGKGKNGIKLPPKKASKKRKSYEPRASTSRRTSTT